MADQLDDTVWIGSNVTVEQMLDGYRRGRFAMPYIVDDIYLWMSPKQRAILPLDRLRVTRSLRQSTKRYTVTFDREFDVVLEHCANPDRRGGWITDLLAANYRTMFNSGYAHSVEVWDDQGQIAGGLFLVNVGGLVSGESMFHVGRDASKVALVALVQRLRQAAEPVLLDTQWRTDHLATLGVIEVPRKKYLTMLPALVNRPNVL